MRHVVLAVWLVWALAGPASAGWLGDAVRGALQGAGERGVNEAVDGAYEGAKGGARKTMESGGEEAREEEPAQAEPAQTEQDEDRAASAEGASASGAEAPRSPARPAAGARSPARGTDTGAAVAEPGSLPNEKAFRNFDFVPGARVLFFDDFSDTDVGEFPRRWTLKGPEGGGNPLEVVSLGDRRYLGSRPVGGDNSQPDARAYLRLSMGEDLPEKFTIEFDAVLGPNAQGEGEKSYWVHLLTETGAPTWGDHVGNASFSGREATSLNTHTTYSFDDNRVHRISISVNGTFLKAYVDGDRVLNDPDALERPLRWVGVTLSSPSGWTQDDLMFTNFRLAEGGKDIKGALETDGRIVAHGIHFDTGSDAIRPESYSTLKRILDLLTADPGLRFRVEGHTDSQGGAGVNQPLSERRAAAVKTWLVAKGVAAERLTSQGLGDSVPLDTNDTAEGRANNRRVEFVRL